MYVQPERIEKESRGVDVHKTVVLDTEAQFSNEDFFDENGEYLLCVDWEYQEYKTIDLPLLRILVIYYLQKFLRENASSPSPFSPIGER